jgi:hypothetical protein
MLEHGEPERLLGTHETDQIEFKRTAYNLALAKGRWELAKDVAGMANRSGGVIVLGVAAEPEPASRIDTAVALAPIAEGSVDWDQHQQILAAAIYPPVMGVTFKWFGTGAASGIGVIEVPAQPEEDRPAVLRRTYDFESDKLVESVAVPVRNGEVTLWWSAERIHHLIRRSLDAGRPPAHPGAATIRGFDFQSRPNAEQLVQRSTDRINQLEASEDWLAEPFIAVQALPPTEHLSEPLPGFNQRDGLIGALAQPKTLRGTWGFNLSSGSQPDVVDGGLVIRNGGLVVWLEADGLFTVAGNLRSLFFGWAMNPDNLADDQPFVLNPTVVVESTLETVRFANTELASRRPGGWQFRIVCRRAQSRKVRLPPRAVRPAPFRLPGDGMGVAIYDDWDRTIASVGSATRDAFLVLELIYRLWGIDADQIPYAEAGEISETQIRDIH